MASSSKMITLKSSDGKVFEVEEAVAIQSMMIKNMIEDDCVDNGVSIPTVTGDILSVVLTYCKKHVDDKKNNSEDEIEKIDNSEDVIAKVKEWDDNFAKDLKCDQDTLYHLIMAANFLNIKGLLDLTCQVVADMIKGKMPEEIRRTLNIKNDFGPGEEEAIIKENAWAFDPEPKP